MNTRLTVADVGNIIDLNRLYSAIEEQYSAIEEQFEQHIIPLITYEKPNNQNKLNPEIDQLKTELEKAIETINLFKNDIQILNQKNIELCQKISATDKQLEETNQTNNRINNELIRVTQENIHLKNNLASVNISHVKDLFEEFFQAYIRKNTKKSSGCLGIFSLHGVDGRNAATQFNIAFNLNKDTINSKEELLAYLKILKINNEIHLTGNYHSASFKTYLLAYYHYVSQLNIHAIYVAIDAPTYVRKFVNNTPDIEKKYKNVFCTNDAPQFLRKRDIV